MKTLLVVEFREGKILDSYKELKGFSTLYGGESVLFGVGSESSLPEFTGKMYLADSGACGDYNPQVHKSLLLDVIEKEQPDVIAFCHSSYGWDLAPRVANALNLPQISEVVDIKDGLPVVPVCNGKMRRTIQPESKKYIVTLQAGAFTPPESEGGSPEIISINNEGTGSITFHGYEEAQQGGVDLTKAEVIVSAGRGVGKPENIEIISGLAQKLGGEYGASRPVVDAEWVDHNRQVGTTGQTVSPKLYVACGISGAIQHLAGMKKSEFVVAINTDKDAPIGEIADVLVVSDVKQFIPALMEKL